MILETQDYRNLAAIISSLGSSAWFTNPILNSRHAMIQRQLQSLSSYFTRLADLIEGTENSLKDYRSVYVADTPGFTVSLSTSGSASGLMRGKAASAIASAQYAAGAGKVSGEWYGFYGSASGDLVVLGASCTASIRLMKDKQFNPRVEISVEGHGHVAAAELVGGYNAGILDASIRGAGELGTVYGEAEAVFSIDEQVLSAQAGAAVARGECEIAIDLAGLKIIIGVSGSVGSAEIGASYENRPGEWEITANGALLVGAGVKIRVEY